MPARTVFLGRAARRKNNPLPLSAWRDHDRSSQEQAKLASGTNRIPAIE